MVNITPITLQVNKNQALRGKEAEKFYEDRDTPIDELKRCEPSRVSSRVFLCYFGSDGGRLCQASRD